MPVEVRLGMMGGAVVVARVACVAESGCMALDSANTGAESEPKSDADAEAEGEANDEA